MTDVLTGEISDAVAVDDNTVYLTLGTESFQCRRKSVSWQMMKFAVAQRAASAPIPHKNDFEKPEHLLVCKPCAAVSKKRNDAGMMMMSTMYDTVMILLVPDERTRFEEFMESAELENEELENAIGTAIAALGSEGKAQGTSSHSSTSEEQTPPPSRTISLSQGIERDHNAS